MNQRTPFENTGCSVARTLNIIGEWWTLLILRDIFYEIRKFSLLRNHLGISKKVLTNRLNNLVENGILKRIKYQDSPTRYEYILTEKGRDLFPLIVLLKGWGDKWIYNNKDIPLEFVDDYQKVIIPQLVNANTKDPIVYGRVHIREGSQVHKLEYEHLMKTVGASKEK